MLNLKKRLNMSSRAFRYFSMCYGVLVCCMLLFVFGVYISTREALANDARHISKLELDNCGAELDLMLNAAGEASLQMSRSTQLKKLAYSFDLTDGQSAYDLYSAMQAFNNLRPMMYLYDGAYMYFPASDRVVTNSTVYHQSEQFFDQRVQSGTYDQWKQQLTTSDAKDLLVGDDRTLSVINDVSFVYPGSRQAVACFYISRARVDAAMRSDYEGSGYCILGSDGGVVMSNLSPDAQRQIVAALEQVGPEDSFSIWLDGQDMLLSARAAQTGSARYVMVVPMSAVYEQMAGVERMLLALVLCLVVSSVLIGMALSMKNTRLIRGFVTTLTDGDNPCPDAPPGMPDGVVDEFSTIEDRIHALIHENINYQNLLVRQKSSLRTAFFFRLFAGEFLNAGEIFAAMNEAGVTLSGNAFVAAIVQCPRADIDSRLLVTAAYDDGMYISPISENTYSALLVLAEATSEAARAAAEDMLKALPDSTLICLGAPCTDLDKVAESYAGVRMAYVHMTPGQSGVVECRRAEDSGLGCMYTYETEGKLLTLVRAGCVDEVRTMLRELADSVDPGDMRELVRCLNTTRMRASHELRLESAAPDPHIDGAEALVQVAAALSGMAEQRREKEATRASQLEISIRKFIMENYLDPSLSLSAIADAMKLSEPYLSMFFKQKTGENVSVYIERLRVDRAYRLLTETDMPIGEVARQSGYQSDQTFRRAFKKLMGCVPGSIRQG